VEQERCSAIVRIERNTAPGKCAAPSDAVTFRKTLLSGVTSVKWPVKDALAFVQLQG
jgi:hypothetical protein